MSKRNVKIRDQEDRYILKILLEKENGMKGYVLRLEYI